MNSYLPFILANKRLLGFGVLLTFFSSYGQTFFISLFGANFESDLGMGKTAFGSLYSLATLASASLLPWVGKLLDEVSLKRYTMGIAVGLVAGCLGMSMVQNTWQVFLCFVLLRLSGQGLCGHTAATTMARSFDKMRGKALSVSGLGFPIGEGILPIVTVAMLGVMNWRGVWMFEAGTVLFLFVPALLWLFSGLPAEVLNPPSAAKHGLAPGEKEWTRGHVLKDPRFYLLLPSLLILPFTITGVVLHQASLVEARDWTMEVMAQAFIGFAVFRVVFSLLVGPIIDRFGAIRFYPFFVWPMIAGLVVLMMVRDELSAHVFLSTSGASLGMASALTASLWAEMYGVRHLGAIKSLGTSIAIFGTSLSPALFGWLLDRDVSFEVILFGNVVFAGVATLGAMVVCLRKPASVSS